MRLTEAGETLLAQIRSWQNDERDLRARIEGIKGRSGALRIGVMECLAEVFLPEVLGRLRRVYPDFSMTISVGGTGDIAGRMLSGTLDYAIVFNAPADIGLVPLHELRMEIGLVVPVGHPLWGSAGIPLERIADWDLVVPDNSLTIGPLVKSMLEGARATSRAVAVTNSVSLVRTLVGQGVGLGLLTWADVFTEVAGGRLCFVPLSGKPTTETLSFSKFPSGRTSALLRDFEEAVIDGMQGLQG
ncbi:hypothetical protein GR170_24400 [Pseudooceanicola sp. GBMRC 2024]|uniref:LysR substrate-binding domain-containing protein n=2 Tax=Paracoccaceae TaxID=31989 RepID=A0A6L7G9V1_9RHOB|nr:hypothetical protein [Pseudooceanicola albus]